MLEVLSFCYRGKGLTSSNKDKLTNFSGEKSKMKLSRLLFEITRKNLKLIPVLVLVPRPQI